MAATLVRDLRANLELDPTKFEKGNKSAAASAKVFEQALKEQEQQARRHSDALDQVGAAAAGFGAALVAGFGVAVVATMDFDKQLSAVGAVSNATAADMEKLREAALQAGKDTAFSATQAAEAEAALAKAGISTADILGGALKGSLALAAAGQVDLGKAAEISAQAMTTFNLKGRDVGHVADVLSAGANKSTATVETLAEALAQGGLVASQMGMSLEETVGTLAAFDASALKGSDAGTSFKTMLSRLVMPEVAQAMKDLNIEVFDAQGNFVGMASLAGQLQAALSGMSQEQRATTMYTLFGSDAIRAANIVYKLGEKGVQDWTKAVDDQGAATSVAAKMTDNLSGDLEKLKGALQTALIEGGSGATGALREMTQAGTGLVGMFASLPQPVQSTLTVVGGLAGVVTAAAGAFVLGAPKVAAFKESLADMGPRGQRFGSAISSVGSFLTGPWGIALAAGTVALGVFAGKQQEAEDRVAALTATLDEQTGALTDQSKAMIYSALESEGALKAADKLKISLKDVSAAALGDKAALDRVNEGMALAKTRAQELDEKWDSGTTAQNEYALGALKVRGALDGSNTIISDAVGRWKRLSEAQKASGGAAKETADAQKAAAEEAQRAAQQTADAWSAAFAQFRSVSAALDESESAAQRQADGQERRAAAQERLASAQRARDESVKQAVAEVAAARERAADQMVAADERVADSQEALADAVEQAAEREADAAEKVEDARQTAADSAEDSARDIEAASQRAADAQEDAAERGVDAERKLADSHERTQEAVEDLTRARERAQERLDDMVRSSASAADDEEGAQIAILRAQERLDDLDAPDSKATDLDRREAALAFKRATDRLEEIKRRNAELREEIEAANAAGIDGSAEVLQAKERIAAAQQAELEAEADLARQREQGAKAVAAAEQNLADAREDSARRQEEAARALAEAETELDRARIASAKDVLQAKKDVAAAEAEAAKVAKDSARDVIAAEQELRKTKQDSARDIVKAQQEVRDSWVELGTTAAVTTEQLLAELDKQVKDQEAWAANLISLAGRVPPAMLEELAALGPGGAQVVALATQMSDKELQKFIELHGRSGKQAGDAFAANLADVGPVLAEIARFRGKDVADKVKEGLDGGRVSVYEAARRLGLEIDAGMDLGRVRTVLVQINTQQGGGQPLADGGIVRAFSDGGLHRFAFGGMEQHVAQIAGPGTRVWAEPETQGEGYVPLALSKRARSERIMSEIAGIFGGAYIKPQPVGSMPLPMPLARDDGAALGGGRPYGRDRQAGTGAWGGFHIENFNAYAGQSARDIVDEFYLLSVGRNY